MKGLYFFFALIFSSFLLIGSALAEKISCEERSGGNYRCFDQNHRFIGSLKKKGDDYQIRDPLNRNIGKIKKSNTSNKRNVYDQNNLKVGEIRDSKLSSNQKIYRSTDQTRPDVKIKRGLKSGTLVIDKPETLHP